MEELIKKYNITKDKSGLYRLNDIVKNMIKSKNPISYMDRIKNKKRNKKNNNFYIDENQFLAILNKSRSKICKDALKILSPTEEIEQSETTTIIDIKNNNVLFEGKKITLIYVNDEIWFKGKDIAQILKYQPTDQALKQNIDDEDKISYKKLLLLDVSQNGILPNTVKKQRPHTIFINRRGLESFLIKSKKPKSIKFAKLLDIDIRKKYPVKECEVLTNIIHYLNEKNINYELQKSVNCYLLDMYLPEYFINIEIDENGHKYRNPIYEKTREDKIKDELCCNIIRFNPDDKSDNLFKFIGRLDNLIDKLKK